MKIFFLVPLALISFLLLSACSSPTGNQSPQAAFTLADTQLPTYEKEIDHKGIILNTQNEYDESLKRGQYTYQKTCFTCHGDPLQNGSIPTAFKFWSDKFKVGKDPYAMYLTLTKGFGSMAPQPLLTPREKYDVIHYIRETYVRAQNNSEYFNADSIYLSSLPVGTSLGPEPQEHKPWAEMDYGNFLINTYEVVGKNAAPRERSSGAAPLPDENLIDANFAYKGIAIRLDSGKGGVAAGKAWIAFDHDLMRVAGGWTGTGFIDWEGILFNGTHNISPRTIGDLHFSNPVAPGWADPATGSFEDKRFQAVDKRRFGPLPRAWSHYQGLYQYEGKTVVAYTVGGAQILEMFGLEGTPESPVFTRTLNATPSTRALTLRIAPASSAVALVGSGGQLKNSNDFYFVQIPPSTSVRIKLLISSIAKTALDRQAKTTPLPEDLKRYTAGGRAAYPDILTTTMVVGKQEGNFQVDVLSLPFQSPWKNQLRLSGIDFLSDKSKAVVCSTDGDVWLVGGITQSSGSLTWKRIASGMFQPLGIKVVHDEIFVTCRDQLVRLHDLNGDGETDFYESFNSDHQVTNHFHEFAMGLQTDQEGNFYYAKSARHARRALVPQHGTLIKVSKDGKKTEIVANGFRAANGVCINPDGSFIVTDQEGHWNPMNRVNWVTPGGFYGNMFGYNPLPDSSDAAMIPPLVWIERHMDQSPSELLWVDSKQWGPLNGSLLNFSYGYGKMLIVPNEKIGTQVQGGVFELPIPRFPTGVMRARFNPADGQLYGCGLSAWGSTQADLGGFYRIRYNGEKVVVPVGLNAMQDGMKITFSHALEVTDVENISNYQVETWDLKRSRKYGSGHYNVKSLAVTKATISKDHKTIMLAIPDIKPTWVMEISYQFLDKNGKEVKGLIQNTIHQLGSPSVDNL